MDKEERIEGYKMFNSDFTCLGKQYKVGESFTQSGKIECCKNGLHFCVNPFDCLDHYDLFDKNGNQNKFAKVIGYGNIDKENCKVAVSNMDIIKELTLKDFINKGIAFIQKETEKTPNNDSGYSAQIGSSGDSAQIGSSGDSAQIGSSGDYAKISSTGADSVICCAGVNSIAKAKKGSWITLYEWRWDNKKRRYVPICVKTRKVDGKNIKEDTFYKLENKKFVEVKND